MTKRKWTVGAAVMLFSAAALWGQDLFVTARVAPLQSEPTAASRRVAMLQQDASLQQVEARGDWYRVRTAADETGWVQELFVGARQAPDRVETGTIGRLETVTTRRRANAYGTSAAAARGLSEDDVRARQNLAFSEYNFQAAEWLERFLVPEGEVLAFADRHGFPVY